MLCQGVVGFLLCKGAARTMEGSLAKFVVLREKAGFRMAGGALPEALAPIVRSRNAFLPRASQALVLASVQAGGKSGATPFWADGLRCAAGRLAGAGI